MSLQLMPILGPVMGDLELACCHVSMQRPSCYRLQQNAERSRDRWQPSETSRLLGEDRSTLCCKRRLFWRVVHVINLCTCTVATEAAQLHESRYIY